MTDIPKKLENLPPIPMEYYAVLDEAMGGAAWLNHIYAMTGQLSIRFEKPLKLGSSVFVDAWVHKAEEKKAVIKGRIIGADGTGFATAEGVFVRRSKEKFQEMGDMPDELFKTKRKAK